MERSCRTIALLLVALVVVALMCMGFIFLLFGDDLLDFARIAAVRFSLAGRQAELDTPAGTSTELVRFTINPGDTPPVIGQNLSAAGLINDAALFTDYVQAERLDVELEAGTYFLTQTQTIPEIALALTDSRNSQITFTILEGWRIEEIAAAIDTNPLFGFTGADFLTVVGPGAEVTPEFREFVGLPAGASLEGFLYPDTYILPPDTTAEGLRDLLLETFELEIGAQLPQDAAAQGWSLFEVATLASIVEREAVVSEEQPLIAGVYRNRLDINQRLEADPTVQYGKARIGDWWPGITRADYTNVVSPYNTYLNNGLPPGPIANPGLAAIQAVVYPEASDFFYFRADCRTDGRHDFARTFEEHLANGC
ncbi:MAG: endolytic transglycosylase MltG [bacterium]|nr:endolytic transglycosylase MltG [bacterium]